MAATAPKRSLFSNKPTWMSSKSDIEPPSDTAPIFGRNEQTYAEILEEEKRKEQRKREKREARLKARSEQEQDETHQVKRRRISHEPESREGLSDAESVKSVRSDKSSHTPVTRSTPRKGKVLLDGLQESPSRSTKSLRSGVKYSSVINLDSDEEAAVNVENENDGLQSVERSRSKGVTSPKNKRVKQQEQDPESEDEEQDPYLRELKRKAREKAKLQQTEAGKEMSGSAAPDRVPSDERSPTFERDRATLSASPDPDFTSTLNPIVSDDPPVAIMIKSDIPNTKPLIVNRRASQPLQQVKDFWCKRQDFDEAFSANVFFTWRGTRLFNSTMMRSIIARLKAENSSSRIASEDPSHGKIMLEAVTPEIFEQQQKEAEQRRLQEAGLLDGSMANDDANDSATPNAANGDQQYEDEEPKRKDGVVIRLKAQGLESMVLRVRPNTSIDKIMRAFQKTREVDASKRCWLVFDGERLDPESSVNDVGFEENDEVEVYPR